MAITPGEGGVDICLVSPSDQAGQINNLLDRVHNLEVAVAQLAGLDVNASNLSDMVASLGTITNGTIIMPDNSVTGWTNSIPPGNFTGTIISNGIITTWNNGVVSFKVLPGSGVTVGSGVTDYMILEASTTAFSSNKPQMSVLWNVGTAFSDTYVGTGYIYINEPGIYHVDCSFVCTLTATAGNAYMNLSAVNLNGSSADVVAQDFTGARDTNVYHGFKAGYTFVVEATAVTPYVHVTFSGCQALTTSAPSSWTIAKIG